MRSLLMPRDHDKYGNLLPMSAEQLARYDRVKSGWQDLGQLLGLELTAFDESSAHFVEGNRLVVIEALLRDRIVAALGKEKSHG
jgi:hypothetical protein